jgi:hypothetical protein
MIAAFRSFLPVATFDLNILPIHRLNGQDLADLPGLLALTPPRKTARGREKDSLILYLMLSGNATFSATEIDALNRKAATTFYQSAGPLTSAMRKVAESINAGLLERNLSTTGRGLYALGFLVLAVVRDAPGAQCTLLLSGPTHAVCVSNGQARHIHDPALSGKGLGSSQSIQTYLAQVELHANDLLVLCGKFPRDWEADLLGERPNTSLEASYRKLTLTKGDLHAALIQSQNGPGVITVLHADVSASRPMRSQPVPAQPEAAPVPQTVTSAESVTSFAESDSAHEMEDIFIESPQDFRDDTRDARNKQPSTFNYPASQTERTDSDSPTSTITEEELDELADFAAHMIQPSAYAIPPQPEESLPPIFKEEKTSLPSEVTTSTPSASASRIYPPSIPRANPVETPIDSTPEIEEYVEEEQITEEETVSNATSSSRFRRTGGRSLLEGLRGLSLFGRPRVETKSNSHAVATRQMAKVMVGGIQSGRRVNERLGSFLRRFIPRLLPGVEWESRKKMFFLPTYALVFIALIIPLLVGTVAVVVYLRFGQSIQYDEYYRQAQNEAARALSESDPARQREAWNKVLDYLDEAEQYRETDQSKQLRSQAQASYDSLMGVLRFEFIPAFANGLSGSTITQISRMAASESDLYMLDAEDGDISHATFTGRSLELDTTFNCQPGTYAGYQVGPLIDLLVLPKINAVSATVLGIDATGHLLYCAPGQVPQAIPLPALPNTNWGRITSFALDNGNLYVLDAPARSIWVFVGKDSAFLDTPYFYFGNQIPNSIDNAIDLSVSGDDLYLLHADGHLSTCTFSRIAETPTRCIDPINFQDPFPSHQDINLFAQAHFTQMSLTTPPNSVILLLDSENRKVFRFTPRSLELQNQVTGHASKGDPFQSGPIDAMTVSPNYVLYLAIGNQVYFATNLP